MSEPRKLHTGGASGSAYSAARPRTAGSGMQDQDQYEAARRHAQQLANQNAHRRVVQQPVRAAQGRHIRQMQQAQEQAQQVQQQALWQTLLVLTDPGYMTLQNRDLSQT